MDSQAGSSGTSYQLALLMDPDPEQREIAWQEWLSSSEGKSLLRTVMWAANRYGLQDDAQDLFEDTLLDLFEKVIRGQIDLQKTTNLPLLALGRRIAINKAKDVVKDRYKKKDEELGAWLEDTSSPQPWKVCETTEQHRCAMNGLKTDEVQILQLVADGYKNIEIAEMLGLSHDNVRTKLSRARTHQKRNLLANGW